MPLYLFTCRACGHEFETLVRAGSEPVCPSCQSRDLERQISTFAVKSAERTRAAADMGTWLDVRNIRGVLITTADGELVGYVRREDV